MKTNTSISKSLRCAAKLIEEIVAEAGPILIFKSQPGDFGEEIANELAKAGKSFVFALRDAAGVLDESKGAAVLSDDLPDIVEKYVIANELCPKQRDRLRIHVLSFIDRLNAHVERIARICAIGDDCCSAIEDRGADRRKSQGGGE